MKRVDNTGSKKAQEIADLLETLIADCRYVLDD